MNRVAIGFLTKDRIELSRRTIEPLLQPDKFDLFWFDGSNEPEGQNLVNAYSRRHPYGNIKGGPDAAVAFGLTTMLQSSDYIDPKGNHGWNNKPRYDYVGLVENDVLLPPDWFDKTMALFEQGHADGLEVGAVSARCYEDRVLIQRPDYAICHNLGFGQQIMTRKAATLALKHMRTTFTTDNRLLFSQLSGIDIAAYWAFRGAQNFLCSDWGQDKILAAHGLASLALTPSPVEMIGQTPSLEEQGLTLKRSAHGTLDIPIGSAQAFELYRERTAAIRAGDWQPSWSGLFHRDSQGQIIFPHQIPYLGGRYSGDWTLKWAQGYGPFAWQAEEKAFPFYETRPFSTTPELQRPRLTVPVLGPCDIMVSGGASGGKVRIVDHQSGFEAEPELYPEGEQGQVLALTIPNAAGYREVELTALSPGVAFYGLRCREQQPVKQNLAFDHSWLPPT